jgi:hypothetical protein
MASIKVSEGGIHLNVSTDQALDVLFDDERVWSFLPERDAVATAEGLLVSWPKMLQPFLKGQSRVTIEPHGDNTKPIFDDEVIFGDALGRIAVVDSEGNQLTVDKGGRLQHGFAHADQATKDFIVDNVQRVLRDLHQAAGLEAFLSFGCLLGAVREGQMIGHDADADVSYLSRYTHPFDIARECQMAMKTMRSLGYSVVKMSSANFKIWVPLAQGGRCGVDVFAAYYFEGIFHMLPSVRGELPREALLPTSTVRLEGREIVAPASPEDVLAVTYGPNWRVPDPAFKFPHPPEVVRHMAGYFQGSRVGLRYWHEFYKSAASRQVRIKQSTFVTWVATQVKSGDHFLDIGYGNGRDAVWLATQGFPVTGLEFSSAASHHANDLRRRVRHGTEKLAPLRFKHVNFNNLDDVLVTGAHYAFEKETHHLYARFLLDALTHQARADFWRFASMVQRRGGRTFLEFRTHCNRGEPAVFGQHRRTYLDPDLVTAEITERGGKIVEHLVGRGVAVFNQENPEVCRLVVRWDQ